MSVSDQSDGGERKERTALANDRTMLASERTLAAWWRTAIAALAAAVGLVKLLEEEVEPLLLVRLAATLPILLALLVLYVGARRYSSTAKRIEAECVERVPRMELWIGTTLLTLLAAAAAIVWVLE